MWKLLAGVTGDQIYAHMVMVLLRKEVGWESGLRSVWFLEKKWFSNLELNEIKEKLMGVTEESDESACEGFVGIGKEDNVACESVMLCWKILV